MKAKKLAVACLAAIIANSAEAAPPLPASGGNGAVGRLARATDMGPESTAGRIELTVWLKLRDSDALDRTLAAQSTSRAAWLSKEQIDQLHAPGAADVAAVSAFLKAQGFTVTTVGPHNLFVKAAGTVATANAAFNVHLHHYTFRGTPFHASSERPTLPASIAPLVVSVGGLTDLPAMPLMVFPHLSAAAGASTESVSWTPVPLSAAEPQGLRYSAQCFYPPTTVSFSSGTVTASYSGAVFGASINNTAPGTLPPCGYQASDLQTAYNLTPLYKAGLDGTGETIAIVDAYGSTTLPQDVAKFSALMGLPPAKLQILGTPTGSYFSSNPVLVSWAGETIGDVEEVHAIAPGANILLVIVPSNSLDDLAAGLLTAAQQPGVVSISNSWGVPESLAGVAFRTVADGVLKLASCQGISANFGSGDDGDFAVAFGITDVLYPASSPYATAVGGVSVALDQDKHILFQTAWGNNLSVIAGPPGPAGSPPFDPPIIAGFIGGSGGGVSSVYPLPSFQASLRSWGRRRLVPDISWVADPFTGIEFVFTTDAQGDQSIITGGGTSVASPMFSALWGIAAQRARRPLGQAAPLLYRLPPGAITDVVAPTSLTNVTGTLSDVGGTQQLTAEELALPLQGQATFLSALVNPVTRAWFVMTFGVDSTLPATPGWDPATGLGTPNAEAFVKAFAPAR